MSDPKDLESTTDPAELSDDTLDQAEGGFQSLSNVMNTVQNVEMGGTMLTIDAQGTYDHVATTSQQDGANIILRKRPGQ